VRIVLDTNVCLDLFVYRDAACSRLMAALQAGAVEAVTRADCRDEWLRVLHYPQFRIDDAQREAVTAQFDATVRLLGPDEGVAPPDVALPRCADADDQKFLELALAAGAAALLTKDRALLKLARRTARAGWFAIALPQAWNVERPSSC
jgi:putative PIN family toxin of toxin-antitoxin system